MKSENPKSSNFNSLQDALTALPKFTENKITEFVLNEKLKNKAQVLQFLEAVAKYCPTLFLTIPISIEILDRELAFALTEFFCTIEIPLTGTSKKVDSKNDTKEIYLFDKKKYAGKISMLNDLGLVFGFDMDFAVTPGDSVKAFRERFDFALSLYPNHIDFAQLENESAQVKPTATFSTQDLKWARELAFACKTFYSCGRAVPWFLQVLQPLKIQGQKFFSDFAEWQRCNNCSLQSGFNPENVSHAEIEKMQLNFLTEKYEEKHKHSLLTVVQDLVRLNGAFSRLAGEGEESVVSLSYNPEDLLSPQSLNIQAFADNVLMEMCNVKVFASEEGPDFKFV